MSSLDFLFYYSLFQQQTTSAVLWAAHYTDPERRPGGAQPDVAGETAFSCQVHRRGYKLQYIKQCQYLLLFLGPDLMTVF